MKRGDGVWFNVGGMGDRGLVLEVAFKHRHPLFGERAISRMCCRVLWHDGSSETLRPKPWVFAAGTSGRRECTGHPRHWYPVEYLVVEYSFKKRNV